MIGLKQIWASALQNLQEYLCNQERLKSAYTSTQYGKDPRLSFFR